MIALGWLAAPLPTASLLVSAVAPDKITISQRLYGPDRARLRREMRRVAVHEVAAPLRHQ